VSRDVAAEILEKVELFPPMPGNAARVIELLMDRQCDLDEVAHAVRYDAGLTANVVKIANSAYFGAPGRIGSVQDALVRLGTNRVFQLVLLCSVNTAMGQPVRGYDLLPGELWCHAIAVSVSANDLATTLRIPAAEQAFTAGLLHDLGKLVMGEFVQAELEDIETLASSGQAFDAAERKVLGVDHAQIGATILESWSFPPALVSAVRWHHRPEQCQPAQVLADVVHVAEMLCMMTGFGPGRESLRYEISPAVQDRLGLDEEQLEAAASRTLESVEELTSTFGAGGAN
jgi:putative nucleotidyltransferase with HDIG domain